MKKFRIFGLNFSRDMTKMLYFFKNAKHLGALRSQRRLTFDNGDLKLHDLVKSWVFLT